MQDKNVALLAAATDIFGLNRPWDKVKDGLSDARIREFYRFVAGQWPVGTDQRHILPPPDSSLRALYLGENEPEMMVQNVFRFSLYADQILVINPFMNPNVLAQDMNPILRPGEWRFQTLRLIYQLAQLAPWIYAGLVILIPDPGDFDRSLRLKTWDLAMKRLNGWEPSQEEKRVSLSLSIELIQELPHIFVGHPRMHLARHSLLVSSRRTQKRPPRAPS